MLEACAFETERLRVHGWHERRPAGAVEELPGMVAAMLSPGVTRWLPPSWQGPYSVERAARWIEDRDREGPVSIVEGLIDGQPLGLVLLFADEAEDGGLDVRLGYFLAEGAWGRGYGSELLGGFLAWCAEHPDIRTVTGGVAPQNTASIRLLEHHGFTRLGDAGDEWTYRLGLDP